MAAVLTQLLPSRRSRSQTQQQRAFIKEAGIDSDMLERDDEVIALSKRAAVQKEEPIEEAIEEAEEEAIEEVEEEPEEEATKEAEGKEEDNAPQESDTVDITHALDGDEEFAQQEDVSAEAGNLTSGLSSDGEESGRPDHKRRRTQRNEHHPKRRRISAGTSDAEPAHKTDGEDDAESGSSAADESSSEVEQWEEASEGQEVVESEAADVARCMFCHETEENDPGEEFEEILTCVVCGDSAHRQCARDEDVFANENDASHWCCSKCVHEENEYDDAASHASDDTTSGQRRSSAPKFARDLLPAQNGSIKEGSHSIFNNLILDDDPMDGSRSLRKRKASGESDTADLVNETRKRLRRSLARPVDEALETVDSDDEDDGPAPKIQDFQSSRSRRQRPARIPEEPLEHEPLARVTLDGEGTLMMCFKVDRYALGHIRDEYRKRRKRERERDRQKRLREGRQQTTTTTTTATATAPTQIPGPIRSGLVEPAHYPSIQVSNIATPFLALHDREGEGERSKPYGGILTEQEASTEHTFPESVDRKKFEDARQRAEELWRKKVEAANLLDQNRTNPKLAGPPSRIKCISFGNYEIDTWHAAPYPEEYSRNRVLYICEFCLKYLNSDFVAWRHKLKCPARHPPGDEIYSDGNFSFFEVDGRKNPVYCQNLCLLAKLFLGSKTLYYDVEPFLFYVMTENDAKGCHFVGYFSKEKRPSSQNNVSCILVLPIHQRRGFGHYLIDFSYLLTRVEKKTGSPEKPLSDMGLVSYRSYWRLVMCYQLRDQASKVSISDISNRTGMTADDIVSALEGLRALVRDPVTKTYALRLDLPYFKKYIEDYEKKGYPKIVPEALVWVPYVMGRDNMHYESGAPLHTVAQREDLEDAIEAVEGADEGLLAQSGVAEKDYATKSNGLVHTTSLDVDADTEHPPAPFPPIDAADDALNPPRTPNGHTADSSEEASIPPHRFEVFPPVPGSAARRRPGRPFGSRTHKRHAPRAWPFADTPEKAAGGAARSADRVVDGTVNGTGHGESGVTSPASAGVASPPSRMSARRTRSSVGMGEFGEHVDGTESQGVLTGSPLKRVNGAGKVEQDVGVEGGESAEDAVDVADTSLA